MSYFNMKKSYFISESSFRTLKTSVHQVLLRQYNLPADSIRGRLGRSNKPVEMISLTSKSKIITHEKKSGKIREKNQKNQKMFAHWQ